MKKENLKRIAKRITAFAAAVAMAAAFTFPSEVGGGLFDGFGSAIVASAETYTAEYDISAESVTISKDGTYRIYGTTTTNKVIVAKGVSADITLDNVNIDVSKTNYACAFKIEDDSTGNVTIDLVGENTLKSGWQCAGLQKNGDYISESKGKLTINSTSGDGKLTATGRSGAGIGGGMDKSGSNITISGGTVIATGGDSGAGIGGGSNGGSGSNIEISGGDVTATGGKSGAGIGGGSGGTCENITIRGGIVTANGGENAAGIGGGSRVYCCDPDTGSVTVIYGNASDITISGGTVTATGGYGGAGIGGGYTGSGSNITISGGTVTATGDYGGAGIGGGCEGSDEKITISGGSVYAKGGDCVDHYTIFYGADIGGGVISINGSFSNGVPVTPTNGTTGVYLLEIENSTGAAITINGKTYPTNHNGEKKIYAYLPAKTELDPNKIKVGNKTTCLYYDTANSVWKNVNSVTHTITATAGANGSISPSGSVSVEDNDCQTFTIIPDSGYDIDTLTVDNVVVASADSYIFENVTEDHTISVTFKPIPADLTVTGGKEGTDYSYVNYVLTIKTSVPVTISGTTTKDSIVVAKDVSANITLDNVNIDVSETECACAFMIENGSEGNVTIALKGENTLKSGDRCAGLQKNGSNGSLMIKGTGKLTATGGDFGAGIGGGDIGTGLNITISGGTVIATGGDCGAGIGGGIGGIGSNITISGGTVIANGGDSGAGIGGGFYRSGSNITISGGTVTANGGYSAAGIGGGDSGTCSNITISGGSVYAKGGVITHNNITSCGADIGCGTTYDKNTPSDGVPVTPTNGKTPVYLLEIENSTGAAITINGKTYPTNHNGEKKIYAYLPAKTKSDPNEITVGLTTTYWYYDTANSVWKKASGTVKPTSFEVTESNVTMYYTVTGSTTVKSQAYAFGDVTVDMVDIMNSMDIKYVINFVNYSTAGSDTVILTSAQMKAIEYVLEYDYKIAA